jgi:very-short-patch-repair endonuclease
MPEQIDLSRVRGAGVRDLKNYLEFALRGPRALAEQRIPTGMEPDSPFESEVIGALRAKGWTVHPQVGVSGYRIDIGVVDPRAPGQYLLGIECDGRTYHSGATARDRDRLRQHVLEGLGWQLHRIWSTDWWTNPQESLRKVLARLERLLAEGEPIATDINSGCISAEPPETPAPAYAQLFEPMARAAANPLAEYRVMELSGGLPGAFYENSSTHELRRQLFEVVNTEGPIADSVLFRRVARAWGLAKMGTRIEELLRKLMRGYVNTTREGRTRFYWPESSQPAQWEGFRVAGQSDSSKRAIEEISLEEIGNLALFVLAEHGGTTLPDLARTVCRLLNITRTSDNAEARVRKALRYGRLKALICFDNGVVSRSYAKL